MSAFEDIEDEQTDLSEALPEASTDVSMPLPEGASAAFDDVDQETTSLDDANPSPVGAAPPPLVQPPPMAPRPRQDVALPVSVPDTAQMLAPDAGPEEWSDSTVPLANTVAADPVPVPDGAAIHTALIEAPPDRRDDPATPRAPLEPRPMAHAPRTTVPMDEPPPRRHLGPVPEPPAPPPAPRGIPPIVIWLAVGLAAILLVAMTALGAVWLAS